MLEQLVFIWWHRKTCFDNYIMCILLLYVLFLLYLWLFTSITNIESVTDAINIQHCNPEFFIVKVYGQGLGENLSVMQFKLWEKIHKLMYMYLYFYLELFFCEFPISWDMNEWLMGNCVSIWNSLIHVCCFSCIIYSQF